MWLARRRAWCSSGALVPAPLESCPARTHLARPPSAIHLHHTPRSLHCNLHIYLLSLPTTATLTTAIPYHRLLPQLDIACRHSFGHHHLHIPAGKGATTASETPDTTSIPPRRLGSHDICFGHRRPHDPSPQGGFRCHCDLVISPPIGLRLLTTSTSTLVVE